MVLFKYALFLLLIFFSPLCLAQQEAQDLAQLLQPMRSMQADFKQTILDNRGNAIQKSEGRMALQRPGNFRWEVFRPVPQIIIANTSKLWIYDPDLEQVVIKSVKQSAPDTPVFLLGDIAGNIDKNFSVRYMQAPANWRWFSISPKMKERSFETIQLGFYQRQIKEMRLKDSIGHSTVIQFANVKMNPTLPASLFNFRAPAKVDVIDETKNAFH